MDSPRPAKKSKSIPTSTHRRYRWNLPEIQIPDHFRSLAKGRDQQALIKLDEEQAEINRMIALSCLDPSSLQLPLPENSLGIIVRQIENHLRQWQLSDAIIAKAQHSMVISNEESISYNDLISQKRARLWQMYRALKRQHERLTSSLVNDAMDYDWDMETAYASLLTNMYSMKDATTGSNDRNKHKQAQWAESLRSFYNVLDPKESSNPPRLTWCAIVQDWLPQEKCCAAHIVPHSISYATAGYMFGDAEKGEQILWDTRNGLWICKTVEQAFDAGKAVIIPLKEPHNHWEDRVDRFKLVVLDKSLLEKASFGDGGKYKWKDIHERELQFRGPNRPARRYLYFHFVLTMLRRDRYEPPGWAENTMSLVRGIIWATPGEYLRKSMLRRLAGLIGDVDPKDSSKYTATLPEHDLLNPGNHKCGVFTGIGYFDDTNLDDSEQGSSWMEGEEEEEEEEEEEDEDEERKKLFEKLLSQQNEENERMKELKKEIQEEELMAIEIMATLLL